MNFRVGQKVVCVDAADRKCPNPPGFRWEPWENLLREGAVYEIRELKKCPFTDVPGVKLLGIVRRTFDNPFAASRFRPAVSQFDFHKLVEPQSLEKFKREDEQSQPRRQKKVTQI